MSLIKLLNSYKFKTPEEYADELFKHLSKDNVKLIRLSQTKWFISNTDYLVKEIILREKISNRELEGFYFKFEESFNSKIPLLNIIPDPFDEKTKISPEGICIEYTGYLGLI